MPGAFEIMDEKLYEDKLAAAKRRIDIANRCRMGALFLATIFAGIMTVGYMFFPQSSWVEMVRGPIMWILLVLVLVLVAATFIKFPLIAAHNRIVKNQMKGKK